MKYFIFLSICFLFSQNLYSSECYSKTESHSSDEASSEYSIIYQRTPCADGSLVGETVATINHEISYTMPEGQYGVSIESEGTSDLTVENASDVGLIDGETLVVLAHPQTTLKIQFKALMPSNKSQAVVIRIVIKSELFFRK